MQVIPTADPSRCPLCGQANHCALEEKHTSGVPQPPCWCTKVNFDTVLLSGVPEQARGKACICADCAQTKVV